MGVTGAGWGVVEWRVGIQTGKALFSCLIITSEGLLRTAPAAANESLMQS